MSGLMELALDDSRAKNTASAARNQSILGTQLDVLKNLGRVAAENGYQLDDENREIFDNFGLPFDELNHVGSQAFQKLGIGPEVDYFAKAGLDTPEGILGAGGYGDLNRAKGTSGDDFAQAILSMISQKHLADPGNVPYLGANEEITPEVIRGLFSDGQGFMDKLFQGNANYDRREHGQQKSLEDQLYGHRKALADQSFENRKDLAAQDLINKKNWLNYQQENKPEKEPEIDTHKAIDSILDAGAGAYKSLMNEWKVASEASTMNPPEKPDTSAAEKAAMMNQYKMLKALYPDADIEWDKVDKVMEMQGLLQAEGGKVATREKIDSMLDEARDKARKLGQSPPSRQQLIRKLKDAGWIVEEEQTSMPGNNNMNA